MLGTSLGAIGWRLRKHYFKVSVKNPNTKNPLEPKSSKHFLSKSRLVILGIIHFGENLLAEYYLAEQFFFAEYYLGENILRRNSFSRILHWPMLLMIFCRLLLFITINDFLADERLAEKIFFFMYRTIGILILFYLFILFYHV